MTGHFRKHPLPAIGERFGRWTVIDHFVAANGYLLTRCRCACGNEGVHTVAILHRGRTNSCGCVRDRLNAARLTTHGGSRTRLHKTWDGMKQRCQNPRHTVFSDYGGRGITVCPEWQRFEPFRDWALAHGYNDNLQIDRINNDGGYHPDNCRFVTSKRNLRNKRTTRLITAFGETKAFSAWVEDPRCVVRKSTLLQRFDLGWEPERAITEPPHPGKRREP